MIGKYGKLFHTVKARKKNQNKIIWNQNYKKSDQAALKWIDVKQWNV